MSVEKIKWDQVGERLYETGVDHGIVYPIADNGKYPTGYAWNGLTAVTESPEGAEPTALWADNTKYLEMMSTEEWKGTLEAYMYPDAFLPCDGGAQPVAGLTFGQQLRKKFGLCYRTRLGNDVAGDSYGYKLHLVYGLLASPSEKNHNTVNDSPDAQAFSWSLSSTPVEIGTINNVEYKPVSSIDIDSTKVNETKLAKLLEVLEGVDAPEFSATKAYQAGDYVTHTDATVEKVYKAKQAITAGQWDASKWDEVTDYGPRLPMPAEVITILS